MSAPEFCPHCGAEVQAGARACPECGSDEQTGWSDEATAERLGTPGELDYDEFVRREFGPKERIKPPGIRWFWWLVALILVLVFLSFYLRLL